MIKDQTKKLKGMRKEYDLQVHSKRVELEGIDSDEEKRIEEHTNLYEMEKLKRLEARAEFLMAEKLKLLMMEQKATAHLGYESNVRGEYLEELEAIQESKAKKRE